MRVLVTGAGGMLGQDVVTLFRERGHEVTAATRADLDVLDTTMLALVVPGHEAVINCAAYTAVDAAETDREAAADLNAVAPGLIAAAARKAGARMVQVSTDYVFGGDASEPYRENDPVSPRSVYGRTKADGERTARAANRDTIIVRTAWLYGAKGSCFPKTILRLARERGYLKVVQDQIGQPTWTLDVALFIAALLETGAPAGNYHATASGKASWYDFAQEILRSAGLDSVPLTPASGKDFAQAAERPHWSVLDHKETDGHHEGSIGNWRDRWLVAAKQVTAT